MAWSYSAGELMCNAVSDPPPSYRWTYPGDDAAAEEGKLVNVDATEHERVTCTASNTVTHANGTKRTCSDHLTHELSTYITKSDRI